MEWFHFDREIQIEKMPSMMKANVQDNITFCTMMYRTEFKTPFSYSVHFCFFFRGPTNHNCMQKKVVLVFMSLRQMLLTISNSFCCCRIITSCLLYFIRIIHDCGNKTISHKQHKTNAHSHRTNLIIPHSQSIAIFIYFYSVDSLFIYLIWFAYFKRERNAFCSIFLSLSLNFASRFSFLSFFL